MEIGFPVLGVDLSLTLGHTQLEMGGCFFWFCVREPVAWRDAELLCGPCAVSSPARRSLASWLAG